jgi:hypothetical protein
LMALEMESVQAWNGTELERGSLLFLPHQ